MFGSAKSERRGHKYLQPYLQYLVGYAVGERRRINRPGRTEASSGEEQPGGCKVAMGRCGRGWGGGSRRGVLSSSFWGGRTGGWGPPSACQVRERGQCRPGWVGAGGHRPCPLARSGGGGGAQGRLCLPPGRGFRRRRAKPWTPVAAGSCSYLGLLHPPRPLRLPALCILFP